MFNWLKKWLLEKLRAYFNHKIDEAEGSDAAPLRPAPAPEGSNFKHPTDPKGGDRDLMK